MFCTHPPSPLPHPQFQSHIFTCLAAVLHMGNVKFSQDDNEYSQIVSTAPLQTASVRNTLTSLTSSHIHTHKSHILTHTHSQVTHSYTHSQVSYPYTHIHKSHILTHSKITHITHSHFTSSHTHTPSQVTSSHTHHTPPTHHCTAPNYQHTSTPTNMYTYSAHSHSHTLTLSHTHTHTHTHTHRSCLALMHVCWQTP